MSDHNHDCGVDEPMPSMRLLLLGLVQEGANPRIFSTTINERCLLTALRWPRAWPSTERGPVDFWLHICRADPNAPESVAKLDPGGALVRGPGPNGALYATFRRFELLPGDVVSVELEKEDADAMFAIEMMVPESKAS